MHSRRSCQLNRKTFDLPMAVDHCRDLMIRFLQDALPVVARQRDSLPTIAGFAPEDIARGIRYSKIELPNWWRVKLRVRRDSMNRLQQALESTQPFSLCIGKDICTRYETIMYRSGKEIARHLLVAYLFTGSHRWNRSRFEKVWTDFLAYCDPACSTLDYRLYAPLVRFNGVKRRLRLNATTSIVRLPPSRVATLGSCNRNLAGFTAMHGLTLWTHTFVEKTVTSPKRILSGPLERIGLGFGGMVGDTEVLSFLNEELAMLRCLLDPDICLPSYGVVRDGSPRVDTLPGLELPWTSRPPFFMSDRTYTPGRLRRYSKRRSRFVALNHTPEWGTVSASMRRFAAAWQNAFPADILADIVAALEKLTVGRNVPDVGRKVRERTACILGTTAKRRKRILGDVKTAYKYRSRIVHGDYIFDDVREWSTARRLNRAEGKKGNPFHHSNEIRRLTRTLSDYYRRLVIRLIDKGDLVVDWANMGL